MHNICKTVWDPVKARSNYRKHGIRFSDAATVFDDPQAISIEDNRHHEPRFITLGSDLQRRILVVVYCYPEGVESVRIISARRATPSERRQYEQDT